MTEIPELTDEQFPKAIPGPSAEALDALEDRYRQHVVRWLENLTFQGQIFQERMRAPKPVVLPLEDVYVELRAVAEVPEAADAFSAEERRLLLELDERDGSKRRELMSQLDVFRRERWSRTVPERKSMAEALHQRDRHAFVILGDPGSGKTTLLHFLALVYARGPETAAQRLGVDPAEADRLPIFVPLAAFDDMLRESRRLGESLTLIDFLPRYYDRRRGLPGLEPLFRRALESGRALVLLDGLDEVLDAGTRTDVARQVSALIDEWSVRGVRVAVSSRFVGYREAPLPGLPTLSVLDFGTPEIETFVRRWAHAFEKSVAQDIESPEMLRRAQTLEAGLMDDVRSNESVRRLAANPLMLSMLALLRRQVGRLPHRRAQLYECYVGTLLENRVDAENILIPLAFWLQKEKPGGTAGRAEIRNRLVEGQMAGLIVERGHDAFGFLHLTFQEYFAGRALAQLGDEERWEAIRRHLHDPRWREPILLCAGRLGVVENLQPQVTQLVRDILDHEDPHEADLHRNLLLALAIACDEVNLEPPLVNELVEKALALLMTSVYALARELVRLLGQLIVNGRASFDLCLARVEESKNIDLQVIAIEEWGRLDEVQGVDAWLRTQLDIHNGQIVSAALDALAPRFGEDASLWQRAISFLDNRRTSTSAARALARIASTHPEVRQALMELRAREESTTRWAVVKALSGLVKSDAEVRSFFLDLLKEDARGAGAAARGLSVLAGQDPEVREALLKASVDNRSAIDALADLVENDAEVRRTLLERLRVRDVRESAVKALAPILATDSEALAKVAQLLEHDGPLRLSWYLESLKICLPEVSQIQETFSRAMGAVDWRVRRVACQGLGESDAASHGSLVAVLRERDTEVEARQIFRWCGQGAESRDEREWITFWMKALRRPEPAVRSGAVSALSRWVGSDRKIRRAVLKRLGDRDHGVWYVALTALSRIMGTDEKVRRVVLELLDDESSRQSALFAISGIVGVDEEARRAALRWLKNGDAGTRRAALTALSGIVGTDGKVRQLVLERLTDEDSFVRSAALEALSEIVGTNEKVRRLTLEWLADGSSAQSALYALDGIMGMNEEVRRMVLERLSDGSDYVREAAVSALSGIVETDEEARNAVLARLEDESFHVRQQAVRALASLVAEAGAVRQAILPKLEDPDFSVRVQVVGAVARCREEAFFETLRDRLWPWLGMGVETRYDYSFNIDRAYSVQAQLARRFGARIPTDPSLRDDLLAMLRNPRWSARLGAALALLAWPGGPPGDILAQVFSALEDRRGLEAYPAQLTAASFLINQNATATEAIDLCLEALDYGTQPWEDIGSSREIRKQAALVLGKLEPVFFEPRVYEKLLRVMHHDEEADVRDAAYGTLVRLARLRDRQAVA